MMVPASEPLHNPPSGDTPLTLVTLTPPLDPREWQRRCVLALSFLDQRHADRPELDDVRDVLTGQYDGWAE